MAGGLQKRAWNSDWLLLSTLSATITFLNRRGHTAITQKNLCFLFKVLQRWFLNMTMCSMGKVELIFLLENCLYVYVSNVFIIAVGHCSLNSCLFAKYSFRIREDKRKWCVLKQVQSGTVKQGQNFPCPDQRCPIPSRSHSIQWWKNDLHNPGCLWMCRFVHLVISDIYSFFNFIFLLRMGVSTVLCWGILAMHSRGILSSKFQYKHTKPQTLHSLFGLQMYEKNLKSIW